jgi:hypothetical protein
MLWPNILLKSDLAATRIKLSVFVARCITTETIASLRNINGKHAPLKLAPGNGDDPEENSVDR